MNKQIIAMSLSAIGIIFFLTIPFKILPENYGTFGGVAFFVLAGLAWAFWPNKKDNEKK
jgi:hypothetical protein